MDFLSENLQVWITMGVIVGTAVIAGICDALRAQNEKLKDELMELRLEAAAMAGGPSISAIEVPGRAQKKPVQSEPAVARRAAAVGDDGAAISSTVQGRGSRLYNGLSQRTERRAPSAEALAVMQQGLQMAGGEGAHIAPPPVLKETPNKAASQPVQKKAPGKAKQLQGEQEQEAASAGPAPGSAASSDADESRKLPRTLVPADVAGLDEIPAGFQDGYVLTQLVKAKRPVSGLVVAVGVNHNGAAPTEEQRDKVRDAIQALLGPADFAAQSSENEFLLVLPNAHGGAAQRRLSEIAQQLWDLQIRSLANYSILFSWGGVEVKTVAIDEAIASANKRMQLTKPRNTGDSGQQHKSAAHPAAAGGYRQAV